jgi:DNA-binding ferritin-like protein
MPTPIDAVSALSNAWDAIRGLHHLLWSAHWAAEGDPQYGDHLLYQRLYEAREKEIDGIAEQLVLIGGVGTVSPLESWAAAGAWLKSAMAVQQPTLDRSTLAATMLALNAVNRAERAFRPLANEPYSLGVVNLLAGIAQSLNEAIYLLKRRTKTP